MTPLTPHPGPDHRPVLRATRCPTPAATSWCRPAAPARSGCTAGCSTAPATRCPTRCSRSGRPTRTARWSGGPGSLRRDGWTFTGWGRAATDPAGHYSFTTLAPGRAAAARRRSSRSPSSPAGCSTGCSPAPTCPRRRAAGGRPAAGHAAGRTPRDTLVAAPGRARATVSTSAAGRRRDGVPRLPRESTMTDAYVYDAVRTPFGRFGGALAGVRPDDLAATVAARAARPQPRARPGRASTRSSSATPTAPARTTATSPGWPCCWPACRPRCPASTVNRLCGSSLDAAMSASRAIETGDAEVVLAGGVESMTRAPWVLPKPDRAFPAGNSDRGLDDAGLAAGQPADAGRVDGLAGRGQRAAAGDVRHLARAAGRVRRPLAPARRRRLGRRVLRPARRAGAGRRPRPRRGHPARTARPRRSPASSPSFRPDGTITAGNASPLNDGASAVLLGSGRGGRPRSGREPVARIAGRGAFALDPQDFGYAPVEAANRALAPGRHRLGRRRRGRAERGVRGAVAGLRRRAGRSTRRSSTPAAAPSRSATRSARPAAGSSARWPRAAARRASAGASPRSASASGRAWPWCSRTSTAAIDA